jgi:hypothetical protein
MSARLRTSVAAGLMLLALALAPATAAHDGSPRLVLEPDRIHPGGVVVVRGEDVGADEPLRLALVGAAGRTEVATVTSDGQGHFSVAIEVTGGAPTGAYAIEATSESGSVLSSALTVEGPPLVAGGGAPPGQDEGFPAAAPSGAVQPVARPIATLGPAVVAPTVTPPADVDLVPFVALGGAIGGLLLLVWGTRRRPGSPTGSADLP